MTDVYQDSSSTLEKLTLIIFIVAIVIGNICVFVTYFVRTDGKHWSNVFVISMAFIDLFIGSFVLPMRFVSAYGSSLTSKLCAALTIGESCALASVIYSILFMVYTRLYDLKKSSIVIRRRYLLIILLTSWIILFLFYGIPFMTKYSSYLITLTSSTSNTTYCTTYTTSIYHPPWMAYTEIGIIYSIPFLLIFIGLHFLLRHLCQSRPRRLDLIQRRYFSEQKQMTRHVVILSLTFIFLWLPWIIIRIIITFQNTIQIQQALQITYYILILKCVIFPMLYASTNASFRGSFAIYRHKRITTNTHVWTTNEYF